MHESQAEAVYVIDSLIPEAPAEPWGANGSMPAPAQPLQFMPFIPVDPAEAHDQGGRLSAAGITLPHLFIEPKFTPRELGFSAALQPVQAPVFMSANGPGQQALGYQHHVPQQQQPVSSTYSMPHQPQQNNMLPYRAPGNTPVQPRYTYQQQDESYMPWGSMQQLQHSVGQLHQQAFPSQNHPAQESLQGGVSAQQAPPIVTSNAQLQSILNAVQAQSRQTQHAHLSK